MNAVANKPARRIPVIRDFNFADFQKKQQRQRANANSDNLKTVKEIDDRIEGLAIGSALVLPIKEGEQLRKAVMRIRAPITNLCFEGQEWAGRKYHVRADEAHEDGPRVIVYRDENETPRKRKHPSERKPKATPAPAQAEGTNEGDADATKVS